MLETRAIQLFPIGKNLGYIEEQDRVERELLTLETWKVESQPCVRSLFGGPNLFFPSKVAASAPSLQFQARANFTATLPSSGFKEREGKMIPPHGREGDCGFFLRWRGPQPALKTGKQGHSPQYP